MYSPTLWVAMSSSLQWTINACESFHSRDNQSSYKKKSSNYKMANRSSNRNSDRRVHQIKKY
jgi:hypothetical protein